MDKNRFTGEMPQSRNFSIHEVEMENILLCLDSMDHKNYKGFETVAIRTTLAAIKKRGLGEDDIKKD